MTTVDATGHLNAAQIAALASTCLSDKEDVVTATAISLAESGGRPSVHGDTTITDGTWGPSIGLWQVRSIWAEEGTGRLRDSARLEDPEFNARSMCEISGGGQNWRPWSVWLNSSYEAHLDEARQAVSDGAVVGQQAALPVKRDLVCPVVEGLEVGDGWGVSRGGGSRGHEGVDLFGTPGSPVVAPFDGTVVDAVNDEAAGGNGGVSVVLRATGGPQAGAEVYMAHNQRNTVRVGQQVKQGEQVALVGNSGNARSTPAHVHLQWYAPGSAAPSPAEPTIVAACEAGPGVVQPVSAAAPATTTTPRPTVGAAADRVLDDVLNGWDKVGDIVDGGDTPTLDRLYDQVDGVVARYAGQ